MHDQPTGYRAAKTAAANALAKSRIYGPDAAVRKILTGRASFEERAQIGLLWGSNPRVQKALRGDFD